MADPAKPSLAPPSATATEEMAVADDANDEQDEQDGSDDDANYDLIADQATGVEATRNARLATRRADPDKVNLSGAYHRYVIIKKSHDERARRHGPATAVEDEDGWDRTLQQVTHLFSSACRMECKYA